MYSRLALRRSFRRPAGRRLALLACAALIARDAGAATPRRPLSLLPTATWGTPDGLPSKSIHAILQSRDGLLWLGTDEGLVRFDGELFEAFTPANTPVFATGRVSDLAEDARGRLWIATLGGGVVVKERGEFRRFTSTPAIPEVVRALYASTASEVWVGTDHGLCRISDRAVRCYGPNDGLPDAGIGADEAHATPSVLAEDGEQALWALTPKGAVRQRGDRFVSQPDAAPAGETLSVLRRRADGSLWAGTSQGTVGRIESGGVFVQVFRLETATPIVALEFDASGNVWTGTRGQGLLRFTVTGGAASLETALAGEAVSALRFDREEALWAATSRGLARLVDAPFSFFTERHGLTGTTVLGLAAARGGVWIVTEQGSLDWLQGERVVLSHRIPGAPRGFVRRVLEDGHGGIWIGTMHGLRRLQGDNTAAVEGPLASAQVSMLHEDSHGDLWVGTSREGLFRKTPSGWVRYGLEAGLPDTHVVTLAEGGRGGYWIGTQSGLGRLRDGHIKAYRRADGLSDELILALHEDAHGVLWIGTNSGLVRFENERFLALGAAAGLSDDPVWAILEDGQGRLWLSTSSGVLRVARADLDAHARGKGAPIAAVAFGPNEGLFDPECIGGFHSAGVRTPDGRIWFATASGVAVVDPAHPWKPPAAAMPSVIHAKVDGRYVDWAPLTLPPGARQVEVAYAPPTLSAPDRARFRYRLDGFDAAWIEAGARRTAVYTNLPPGEFWLRAAVRLEPDPAWIESPATLEVRRLPRVVETLWFRGAAAVSLLLGAWAFYRRRMAQAAHQQSELASAVARKSEDLRKLAAELEDKDRKLGDLAHEDPLTALANRRRFDEALAAEWRRATRGASSLAVVLVEIDGLGAYRQQAGAEAADAWLKAVAAILAQCANRSGELAARFAGDTLALLLPGATVVDMERMRERVRERAAGLVPQLPPDAPTSGSLIVGFAGVVPRPGDKPERLIEDALRELASDRAAWDGSQP